MNRNLHAFFYLMKTTIFEFVCFPQFQKPTNEPRKTPKFGQNYQKSTKLMLVFVTYFEF